MGLGGVCLTQNHYSPFTQYCMRCLVMAHIRLEPSEAFNFKNPDDWSRRTRHFQQFRIASGLDKGAEMKQVSTLLYCLGKEAAILSSINIMGMTTRK